MSALWITALLGGLGYVISLRLHPYRPCRSCNAGRRWGEVFRRSFSLCGKCGGTGRAPRLGVRIFFGETGKK